MIPRFITVLLLTKLVIPTRSARVVHVINAQAIPLSTGEPEFAGVVS